MSRGFSGRTCSEYFLYVALSSLSMESHQLPHLLLECLVLLLNLLVLMLDL
ncbi:unnamed protein product [Haemonchus placei]|uniref:Ovule protein n=1 Tax=Haemonchus placei TaxID=6290 RepID=A0A0N4X9F0_HAEPC|nr:unnamed protein product [Haemonchus placei]